MAYNPIDPATIEVGDPITKELLDLIRSNFEDHETRIQTIGGGSGKISLVNTDVIVGEGGNLTGALFYEVIQDCIITEGAIQLFAKGAATSGSLTVDVKKNSTTNPVGFNSIFLIPPTANMASASDYQRVTGTIDPAAQSLIVGTILRMDITALPSNLNGFRFNLIGEF